MAQRAVTRSEKSSGRVSGKVKQPATTKTSVVRTLPSQEAVRTGVRGGRAQHVDLSRLGSGRDSVFHVVTDLNAQEVEQALVQPGAFRSQKAASVTLVADRLADLLGVRKRDAAQLIGVSESTMSRSSAVSADVLDRTLVISEIFANVAAVLGPEGAKQWFTTPNRALEDQAPHTLMTTRTGERRVEGVIEALLNGAYL